jgi:hypothetical protein
MSQYIMLTANHGHSPDIVLITRPPARAKFQCDVCSGRAMRKYEEHVASTAHCLSVNRFIEQAKADAAYIQQFAPDRGQSQTPSLDDAGFENEIEPPPTPPSPLTYLRLLDGDDPLGLRNPNKGLSSDDSDEDTQINRLKQAFEALGEAFEDDLGDEEIDEAALAADLAGIKAQDSIDWYPFKKKEVISLILL